MAPRLLNGNAATSTVLEPFDTVGDYCLVQFIGRGGMGEVWLGVKRGTVRRVAIKFLHPELAKNDRCVESFRREGEIGMQLGGNGPIVAVHDRLAEVQVGDPACPDRLMYLVLDFVDGVNLRRFAERVFKKMKQRLPIRLVVHIIRLMLRAVDAAHTHGIGKSALPVVHGDINPSNVLISSRGEVKVTDFGISRFAPEPTFISRPVGTLPYMAPEQYLGRICPQNDLYSVGAVLHELLTGEPPLPTEGSPRTTERKLFQDPVPPLNRDDVPPALERLRRGLLEKNVDLRVQNADEALEILATVDQTDWQDELKALYIRMFGPPRSRLTKYLEGKGHEAGSFVLELLRQRPNTAEGPGARPLGGEPPTVGEASSDGARDDDERGEMLWLVDDDDDDDDAPRTEVYHRSRNDVSRTVRLDGTIGVVPPAFAASAPTAPEPPPAANEPPSAPSTPDDDGIPGSPSVAPRVSEPKVQARTLALETDVEDDAAALDAVTTLPHLRPSSEDPARDLDRYPPRPAHLADGVPFQKRRSARWCDDWEPDGVPIEDQVGPGEPCSKPSRSNSQGSPPTRPDQTSDTRPDDSPQHGATESKPSGASVFRARHSHLLVLAIGAGLFGLGLVMLTWSLARGEPGASPHSSHPVISAETGRAEP